MIQEQSEVNGQEQLREWRISEQLPASFIKLINESVRDCQPGKVFVQIGLDWQVYPALLSRWMAGLGPLNQEHVQKLAMHLGPGIYTALGLLQAQYPENEEG